MSDAKTEAMTALNRIEAKLDALVAAMKAAPVARAASDGQARFGNYGRSKGAHVAGASAADLSYYGDGCRRTLADDSKANFHDREKTLLAAIEAEEAKQGAPMRADGGANRDEAPF